MLNETEKRKALDAWRKDYPVFSVWTDEELVAGYKAMQGIKHCAGG